MLSRLPQTGEEIQLNIEVVGIFGQPNLVPRLSGLPPSGLPVAEDLLVNIHIGEVGEDPFEPIGIIYFGIDILQRLEKPGQSFWVLLWFLTDTPNMRFQMEQGERVLLAVHGPPGYQLGMDRVKHCLYAGISFRIHTRRAMLCFGDL